MCHVLEGLLQEGCIAKLADDLYCNANSPEELLSKWERVLGCLQNAGLWLSPSKTIIAPYNTKILGWNWSNGVISASPHKMSTLSTFSPPDTVCGLRSFIRSYKVLTRVLAHCSQYISPLENSISGSQSNNKVQWSDSMFEAFTQAQKSLAENRAITLPRSSDQLWIVTDASVRQRGIDATLYVTRDDQLRLAGFFSAKLRKHQVTW